MFNKAMLTVEVSWWSKGTVMERRMVVLAGLMFLLSLSLIAVLAVSRENQVDQYCFTKECVTAAADILNRMNSSADPCHDFYNFACGGYIENTVIPDDKSRSSMFSELSDQLNEKVFSSKTVIIISPGPPGQSPARGRHQGDRPEALPDG